jgi:hypothetical protein
MFFTRLGNATVNSLIPMLNSSSFSTIILRQTFWRFAVTTSLPLVLSLVSTSASAAQVEYGQGPRVSEFTPTNISPATTFSPDAGVHCPTPAFSVTGFAAQANDHANNDVPFASSNSDLGNYGIAVGFTFPLGGNLSKFCKDFAGSRSAFERKRVEIQLLNAQAGLVKQCQYFYQSGYDFNNKAFDLDGEFSALHPCRSLIPVFINLRPERGSPPPEKTNEPFSPKPTITLPR